MVVSPRLSKKMAPGSMHNRSPPPSLLVDESAFPDKKSTQIHPSSPRMLSRSQYLLRLPHVVALVGIGALLGSLITAYSVKHVLPDNFAPQLSDHTSSEARRNVRSEPAAVIDSTPKENELSSEVGVSIETDSTEKAPPFDIIINADVSDSDSNDPWPRIAWLMSFPNSGTSFTTRLIRHATQKATATNYGAGNKVLIEGTDDRITLPVHEGEVEGPFWSDPHLFDEKYAPTDSGYVFTKTHCGSRCFLCQPKEYIETAHTFLNKCLTGDRVDKGDVFVKTRYDKSLVKKAVHLIRDPFDNVVSRFHLELGVLEKKEPKEFKKYPKDREGFRKFCRKWDAEFAGKELRNFNIDNELLDYIKDVPCHADFFRYVQWHNLASTATRNLQIPTMILHYETYEDHLEENLDKLLTFLEQEKTGETAPFIPGKRYRDYYNKDEIKALSRMIKELANIDIWPLLEHYFDDEVTTKVKQ